jgi:large subunit ribosomal protein L30e
LESAIRTACRTGDVLSGFTSVKKSILTGKVSAVIYSASLPPDKAEELEKLCALAEIPVKKLSISPADFGSICNKPFPMSVLGVRSFGQSPLKELMEK